MGTVNSEIKMQGNNDAWFTTNASVVYPENIVIYHVDGRYKYTDGVTQLSALPFLGSQTLAQTLANGNILPNGLKIQAPDGESFFDVEKGNAFSCVGFAIGTPLTGNQYIVSTDIHGYVGVGTKIIINSPNGVNTGYHVVDGVFVDVLNDITYISSPTFLDDTIGAPTATLADYSGFIIHSESVRFPKEIANKLSHFDANSVLKSTAIGVNGNALSNLTLDDYTNFIHADGIHLRVKATEALVRGDVLKFVGFNAGEQAIEVAKRDSLTVSTIGVLHSTSLAIGEFGLIQNNGLFKDINTIAYPEGTILYPNASGGFTNTPTISDTNYNQQFAYVVRSHAVNGEIMINVGSGLPKASEVSYGSSNVATTLSNLKFASVTIGSTFLNNPADNTSYFMGLLVPFVPSTVSAIGRRFKAPFTGILNNVTGGVLLSTTGSAENYTLRINNVTQGTSLILTSTANFSLISTQFNFNNLNFAVNSGDFLELVMVVPLLDTNPTNVHSVFNANFKG